METSLLRTDKEIIRLYEAHVDMVYRLCITLLKNRFDTEDAVQNTFIKLMHHPKPFDNPEHEKAWLIITASNTCKDILRKASRRDVPLEDHMEIPAPPSADPASSAVLDAVLTLPLKYRTPIYLYYYEGYSGAEIAAILHKPTSTIRNYLYEARQKLKQQLGGGFDEG